MERLEKKILEYGKSTQGNEVLLRLKFRRRALGESKTTKSHGQPIK